MLFGIARCTESWNWRSSCSSLRSRSASAARPCPQSSSQPIPVKLPIRSEPVSYSKEIDEILANKCIGCHGAVLAENRLNLESVAGMLKGGKRGPAIVRGQADQSLLFAMASHRVEPVMPPKDKTANQPLSPEELGLLKALDRRRGQR